MKEKTIAVQRMQDYILAHIAEEISVIGYEWDKENPRIQLETRDERGYIGIMAVKHLK